MEESKRAKTIHILVLEQPSKWLLVSVCSLTSEIMLALRENLQGTDGLTNADSIEGKKP